jgi:hypothetical protein
MTWPPAGATELAWLVSTPPNGRPALACFAKRTYTMSGDRLKLADEQVPLVVEPEIVVNEDAATSWLVDDTDLVAEKAATDVVVKGAAYAKKPVRELDVAVAVGNAARRLRVMGERTVDVRADGSVAFSDPEPFERVALGPENAYGGFDLHAQRSLERDAKGRPFRDLPEELQPKQATWLYQYPRNPVGRGFFLDVDRKRAAGASLPLVEDPADGLTPERFFVRSPRAWLDAPMPAHLGWVQHSWYPRVVRAIGIMLDHESPPERDREAMFADGDDLVPLRQSKTPMLHRRALQGASPGLATERLRGDELFILENLHKERNVLRVSLPAEAPAMRMRPPGLSSLRVRAVLQTVRLEPDRDRASLTWCGSIPLATKVTPSFLMSTELQVSWERM